LYRIVICDDDSEFVDYMYRMILQCGVEVEQLEFYNFSSGEDLVKGLNRLLSCELLVLDMQMNDMDGHATAKLFRQFFPDSILVFCSGVVGPTDESFKVTPYRYLKKSYPDEKMIIELKAVMKKMLENNPAPIVVGKNHKSFVRLYPNDILYIENWKHGSVIHIKKDRIDYPFENKLTTKLKLAELYRELKEYGFEFAHNSYIVNLKYVIKMVSKGVIKLIDGTELNVSRSKLETFRASLTDFLSRKYI